jgi:hypothetical protein
MEFHRLVPIIALITATTSLATDHPPAIAGVVAGWDGQPIESTIILTKETANSFRKELKTDSKGEFVIQILDSDRYRVEVSTPGFYTQSFSPVVYQFPKTVPLSIALMINQSMMRAHSYISTPLIAMADELTDETGPLGGWKLCFSAGAEMSCDVTNQFGQYCVRVDANRGVYDVTLRDARGALTAEGSMDLTGLTDMEDPGFEAVRRENDAWTIVPWSRDYMQTLPIVNASDSQ